ncbi:hypothetical protein AYI70_g837 [Smittium culicis]|uniref:WD repeat-containing protein n=1 Tax=Smittium culicis TaxID=133412 RepID=A0A1R1YF30_9FUNG|nr:hypothetical protein AYI70_g837 [Smittium culicis]
MGIGTIHETFTDFKYNWVYCASLTHGAAIKASLRPKKLGKISNLRSDVYFSNGNNRNLRNNNDNLFEQIGNIDNLANMTFNPMSSSRMQTVKICYIKLNSTYANKSENINPSFKSQPLCDTSNSGDGMNKTNDPTYNIEHLAIIWGGHYEGRVSVQYLNRLNGLSKLFVLMDKRFWHNGCVTSLTIFEQMRIYQTEILDESSCKITQPPNFHLTNVIISGGSDSTVKFWNAESVFSNNNGYVFIIDTQNCEIFNSADSMSINSSAFQFQITVNNGIKVSSFTSNYTPVIIHPSQLYNTSTSNKSSSNINSSSSITHILTNPNLKTILVASVISTLQKNEINLSSSNTNDNKNASANFIGRLNKVSMDSGQVIASYYWEGFHPITSIVWDFNNNLSAAKKSSEVILAGDVTGNIFLWGKGDGFDTPNSYTSTNKSYISNEANTDLKYTHPDSFIMNAHFTPIDYEFPVIKGISNSETPEDLSASKNLSKLTKTDYTEKYSNLVVPIFKEYYLPSNINTSFFQGIENGSGILNRHDAIARHISEMHPLYCSLASQVSSNYEFIVISSGTHLVFLSCGSAIFASLGPIFGVKNQAREFESESDLKEGYDSMNHSYIQKPSKLIPRVIAANKSRPFYSELNNGNKKNQKPKTLRNQENLETRKDISLNIELEIDNHMVESSVAREQRIADSEARNYLQSEYIQPLRDLDLDDEEIVKYAEFLSSSDVQNVNDSTQNNDFVVDGLNDEEMLEYALFLSKSNN